MHSVKYRLEQIAHDVLGAIISAAVNIGKSVYSVFEHLKGE